MLAMITRINLMIAAQTPQGFWLVEAEDPRRPVWGLTAGAGLW
jgi:hypothetical protein